MQLSPAAICRNHAGLLAPVHRAVRLLGAAAPMAFRAALSVTVTGPLRPCTEFPAALFQKRAMCLSTSFNYKRRVFPCQCPLAIFLKKAQEGLRKRAAPRTGAPRARRCIFLARDRPLQLKALLAEDGGGTPLRQSL